MSQTVADVLVGVLEQIGVRHIFGLIGDSLNPIADAIRRRSGAQHFERCAAEREFDALLAGEGTSELAGQ